MAITVEAKLTTPDNYPALEQCAALFSRLERLLFTALYARGETLKSAKHRFLTEHRITARQFNSIHKQLSAKVDSWREMRKLNLATVEAQNAKIQNAIDRAQSPRVIHQKKRRHRILLGRKARIERELAAPVPSICFGSRARFRRQFALKANGYADHAAWKKDWEAARASSFFLLGSADETSGNQNCQYREDGALHLRLPDALGGTTVAIPVKFRYRETDLLAALMPTKQTVTRGPRAGQSVDRVSAVSYRFIRREDRWYVQAMFDVAAAPVTTSRRKGCVGIDLNPWGLAVTRVDASGNPVDHCDIPWTLTGRSEDQNKAEIGDTVRGVVLSAREQGVPMATERLAFAEKKKQDRGAKANELLSAFAYAAFAQMVRGRLRPRRGRTDRGQSRVHVNHRQGEVRARLRNVGSSRGRVRPRPTRAQFRRAVADSFCWIRPHAICKKSRAARLAQLG